jgi:arabinose-5-phosphate isomerase
MIKELFSSQKDNLEYFFNHINVSKTEEILRMILACQGMVVLTGVGKSGIIAEKIAMTWISTGTKALFLPPMNALHGDIGILAKQDIVLCFSKSGETKELLDLIPFVRKKQAKIVSIVSKENSSMEKLSDKTLILPMKRELCPFNLAPTTSTEIQLMFGDVLAVALMRQKNFCLQDFAKNHPAGAIGKQISLQVQDLMIKQLDLPLCRKNERVIDILHELSSKKCGAVLVVDEKQQLEGIFTDGDLRRLIESKKTAFTDCLIQDHMTKQPKTTSKDILVWEVMKQMEADRLITIMPVLENRKVIGLIRIHDIIQAGICSNYL